MRTIFLSGLWLYFFLLLAYPASSEGERHKVHRVATIALVVSSSDLFNGDNDEEKGASDGAQRFLTTHNNISNLNSTSETEKKDNSTNDEPFFQFLSSLFNENGTLVGDTTENNNAAAAEAGLLNDEEKKDESQGSASPSYPILDALIASVGGGSPGRSSLTQLLKPIKCFVEKQMLNANIPLWTDFLEQHVHQPIREIISNALDRLYENIDRGLNYNARVLEAVDEEIYISENYVARIKGVTIAAYVMEPVFSEQGKNSTLGKMAFAAEVIMTPTDRFSSFADAQSENLGDDYNISVLLETNVITMREFGAMHWPGVKKGNYRPPGPRYCFDDFHPGATFEGVMRKGHPNEKAFLGTRSFERSLILPIAGSSYVLSATRTIPFVTILKSRRSDNFTDLNFSNESARLALNDSTTNYGLDQPPDYAIQAKWLEESYRDPKPAIVARREAYQREYAGLLDLDPVRDCILNVTQNYTRTFVDISPCYDILYDILQAGHVIEDLGLSEYLTDSSMLHRARFDYNIMTGEIEEWHNYWVNKDEKLLFWSEVPHIFSQAIASGDKVMGSSFPSAFLANPYFPQEELYDRLSSPDWKTLVSDACAVTLNLNDDLVLLGHFPAALKTRLFEVPNATEWSAMLQAEPLLKVESRPLADWGLYGHPDQAFFSSFFTIDNGEYLNQTVEFSLDEEEGEEKNLLYEATRFHQMIQRGNLTENRAGRTQEYYVVTRFPSEEDVQHVVREQLNNSNVWARTAAKAIEADNPCRNAADDSDMYLYVLGIIAATCGGMQTILLSIHQSLHFFTGPLWGESRRSRCCSLLSRIVPTYELVMAFLGVLILLILYYPILLQLRIEQEVSEYEKDATDLDVEFSGASLGKVPHFGRFALVTLVHVSSSCQQSRVSLIRSILIVGVIFGLFMNGIFFWSSWKALTRYLARVRGLDHTSESDMKNVSPEHADFRLLDTSFRQRSRQEQDEDGLACESELVSLTTENDGKTRGTDGEVTGDEERAEESLSNETGGSSANDCPNNDGESHIIET